MVVLRVPGSEYVLFVNVGGVFLADALEDALGAGALDAHGNARIFRLERLADLLRERKVDRV